MSDDVQPSSVNTESNVKNSARPQNKHLKHFKKGQSGNPGGRPKKVDALKAALLAAVSPKDIQNIAAKLIDKSLKGDVSATHELLDRLFGKAKEAIEVTGPNGGDLRSEVKHTFDHARFAELYLSRTGRNQHGPDHASGNGNGKSLHPDSSN